MATDWIKMRTDLYRDPKVCAMADLLGDPDGALAKYVNQNCRCNMAVTSNALRNAVTGALVTVWGVTRQRGKRKALDLRVANMRLSTLDDIADLPGFGEAMNAVGWVRKSRNDLVFPNFFEDYNSEPDKEKNAERQRKFRERRNALRNVTMSHREEKRREEKREVTKVTSRNPPTPFSSADVEAVCDHYRTYHTTARPSGKDRDKIKARLAEGYTAADLCAAIDGNHRSPWHNGSDPENKSGTKYHKLELIVRDSAHVQQFLEVPVSAGPVLSEKTRRTVAAGQSWLQRKEREDAERGQATVLEHHGGNGERVSR